MLLKYFILIFVTLNVHNSYLHSMNCDLAQDQLDKQLLEAFDLGDFGNAHTLITAGAKLKVDIFFDNHWDIRKVKFFLKHGENTSDHEITPLMIVMGHASEGPAYTRLIRKVIFRTKNLDNHNNNREVSLILSVRTNRLLSEHLDPFINLGIDLKTSIYGTVLHEIIERPDYKNYLLLIQKIIEAGIEVNGIRSFDGKTALHCVKLENIISPQVITLLIEAGANVNIPDNPRYTPIVMGLEHLKYSTDDKFENTKNSLIAMATSFTPQEIQHIMPTALWLLKRPQTHPLPKDLKVFIMKILVNDLIKQKTAFAQQHLTFLDVNTIYNCVVRSFKHAFKNPVKNNKVSLHQPYTCVLL